MWLKVCVFKSLKPAPFYWARWDGCSTEWRVRIELRTHTRLSPRHRRARTSFLGVCLTPTERLQTDIQQQSKPCLIKPFHQPNSAQAEVEECGS